MKLDFVTVDVFTEQRFGGNPVAVVLAADGLSSEQMQQVANEFNLAETTFVLQPKNPANDAHVRIFTPKAEMPFAGHPNIGTAFALARLTDMLTSDQSTLHFEEQAGLVPINLERVDGEVAGATLAAPLPIEISQDVAAEIVAKACALEVEDIDVSSHAPCITSTGARFVTAAVKSTEALARASYVTDIFVSELPLDFVVGVHLYVASELSDIDYQARMFAPLHGIPEDPATGSATVNLIGLLATLSPQTDGDVCKRIAQGNEMGRPSVLIAGATKRDGRVVETRVGGRCVPVMNGQFEIA